MYKTFIVEDSEQDILKLKTGLLQRRNFEIVHTSKSIYDALDHFRSKKPELVFLDIQLPRNDSLSRKVKEGGIEVLREIKKSSFDFKLIVISADRKYEKILEWSAIVDYLIKPFSPNRLQNALDRFEKDYSQIKSTIETKKAIQLKVKKNREFFYRNFSLDEIYYILSDDNSSLIFTSNSNDKKFVSGHYSLMETEKHIENTPLIRINKRTIVNTKYINKIPASVNPIEIHLHDEVNLFSIDQDDFINKPAIFTVSDKYATREQIDSLSKRFGPK